jgi:hypothetical protein
VMVGFLPHPLIQDLPDCIRSLPIQSRHMLDSPIPPLLTCSGHTLGFSFCSFSTGAINTARSKSADLISVCPRSACLASARPPRRRREPERARVNKDTEKLSGRMKPERNVDRPRGSAQ